MSIKTLKKYIDMANIAEDLDDNFLNKIGDMVVTGADEDEESRSEWLMQYEEALKLAKQVKEGKNTPWPKSSNVKMPLLTNASIQFNARTMPEIVKNDKVVEITVDIPDQTGQMSDHASRLSNHMSWQLLNPQSSWKWETDRLLMALPIAGIMYRKVCYDPIEDKPHLEICLPQDIIVNQGITSIEKAPRVTHRIYMTNNELLTNMRSGLFLDYPLSELASFHDEENYTAQNEQTNQNQASMVSTNDKYDALPNDTTEIYEQHCFLDLDGDGYQEPYIVTVHTNAKKVLRIVARYKEDSLILKNNKLIKIKPINYFADYHFLPSMDGSFHSLGFGVLLLPINKVENTIINQLLDAGTLANTGGGFLGSALRIKSGDMTFKLGEWKKVQVAPGQTLAQNFVPFPAREPSATLFNLLGAMESTGKELASINDVMLGQPPGANTPATTVMALIEQGMKVYSSILGRLYNALQKEFNMLYEINRQYRINIESITDAKESGMLQDGDYAIDIFGVYPVADPQVSSDAQRLAQAQALMQLMQAPGVDQREILDRWLTALKVPAKDKILLPPPDPNAPPPPQVQLELEAAQENINKIKMETAQILANIELDALKLDIQEKSLQLNAATAGANVVTDKVNSYAQLANVDMAASKQAQEMAEGQLQHFERTTPMQPNITDIQQQIAQLQQLIQSIAPQQQPQAAQQGMPQQQGEMAPISPGPVSAAAMQNILGPQMAESSPLGAQEALQQVPQGGEQQSQEEQAPA